MSSLSMSESEILKLRVLRSFRLGDELAQDACRSILAEFSGELRAIHVIAATSWALNDGCEGASPEEVVLVKRIHDLVLNA